MKEFFYFFMNFFQNFRPFFQGPEENAHHSGGEIGQNVPHPADKEAQRQEIQRRPQGRQDLHEEPLPPLPGPEPQHEKGDGGGAPEKGVRYGGEDTAFKAPAEYPQKIVDEPDGRP